MRWWPHAVALGAGILLLGVTVAGAAFVYDMGAVSIRVEGKRPGGDNLRLILPAAAAPVGLWFMPKERLRQATDKSAPYLPALRVAAQELERLSDFTLVEVTSPRETVRIQKSRGHLVIDVDDTKETVHVSLPLKAVRVVATQLAALSDRESRDNFPPNPATL
jgi:hypothetical protein